jgi:hypothetical protein
MKSSFPSFLRTLIPVEKMASFTRLFSMVRSLGTE